mgnify:CR=1 FL=1
MGLGRLAEVLILGTPRPARDPSPLEPCTVRVSVWECAACGVPNENDS